MEVPQTDGRVRVMAMGSGLKQYHLAIFLLGEAHGG